MPGIKMAKQIAQWIGVSLMLATSMNVHSAHSSSVSMLAPESYISPEIINVMHNNYGILLIVETFSTENVRDAMIESQKDDFDIVVGRGSLTHHLIQSKSAKPLPYDIAKVNSYEKNEEIQPYSLLLSYSQYGIAQPTSLNEFATWDDFFNKEQRYRGKVSLADNKNTLLKALSANNKDHSVTDTARDLWRYMKRIKPSFVRTRDYQKKNVHNDIHFLSHLDFELLKKYGDYTFYIPEGRPLLRRTYATMLSNSNEATAVLRYLASEEGKQAQFQYHHEIIVDNVLSEQVALMREHNIISPMTLPRTEIESDAEAMKKAYLIDRIVDAYQD